jgi:hypothetical protein
MSEPDRKKERPRRGQPTDEGLMMQPQEDPEPSQAGSGCGRPDLAARLADFPELDLDRRRALADHAAQCAECGPKLELVVRAQSWLAGAGGPVLAGVCPPAEALYDFGQGPGSRALGAGERLSIASHVASCAECAELVATLRAKPPVPIVGGGGFEPSDEPARAPRGKLLRFAPLALAAAAAAIAVAVWIADRPAARRDDVLAAASIRYPAAPVLRGESPGALLFPRGRVLACGGTLFAEPTFEVEPQPRATAYVIRIARHDGGAFAEERDVARLEGASPTLAAAAHAAAFTPGWYTWEAWARVDGLDLYLGRRDFEVAAADDLCGWIDARRGASEPARSEAILHLLVEAGFPGDARAYARGLPASPARDEFLSRPPR